MAAMMSGGDSPVYEGFLCPMCLHNFDSVYKLQSHVESIHGTEDRAVFHQLKGFFGKAKRLITNKSEDQSLSTVSTESPEGSPQKQALLGSDPFTWTQELGAVRSHFDFLRRIRSDRIDRTVVDINKLVIRLEKLIKQGPPWSDQAKRKVYEKTVVPWAEDSDVRYCPSCGDKFSLGVRRHHCRLCGSIMCNKCSLYVGLPFCEQVLDPENKGSKPSRAEAESASGKKSAEISLRVCKHCMEVMEKRLKLVRERTSKPAIIQIYQKLIEVKEQITRQLPIYEKTAGSLTNGEEEYSYERVERERTVLLKYFDALDMLSKKISSLGSGSSKTLSNAQMKIRKNIRAETVRFLQENMLGLQPLPTQEEVLKLQAQRRAAIARRLEEERQARAVRVQEEAEALERSAHKAQAESRVVEGHKRGHERKSSWGLLNKIKEQAQEVGGMMGGLAMGVGGEASSRTHPPTAPSGWKPSAVSQESVQALSDDPLIQQMNIISSYLNQAQDAGRWDEVNMLEANLKDLQLAYRREQASRSSPAR